MFPFAVFIFPFIQDDWKVLLALNAIVNHAKIIKYHLWLLCLGLPVLLAISQCPACYREVGMKLLKVKFKIWNFCHAFWYYSSSLLIFRALFSDKSGSTFLYLLSSPLSLYSSNLQAHRYRDNIIAWRQSFKIRVVLLNHRPLYQQNTRVYFALVLCKVWNEVKTFFIRLKKLFFIPGPLSLWNLIGSRLLYIFTQFLLYSAQSR